ncbi:hypothetical protein [Roseburia faecis]|uniref:hypothetical protein n=1 Tax=Roseburia faecis TaxID=301302 RepID=UPI003F943E94
MDKIILKNKKEFEIADGASLGNIQIQSKNFDGIKAITDAFAENNLAEVTFTHNDAVSGKYTDLKSDGFTYMPNMGQDGAEDGTYTVTIRLRTKTEIEKRLDALETGQVTLQQGHESNAGAIEDLAGMIGGEE